MTPVFITKVELSKEMGFRDFFAFSYFLFVSCLMSMDEKGFVKTLAKQEYRFNSDARPRALVCVCVCVRPF